MRSLVALAALAVGSAAVLGVAFSDGDTVPVAPSGRASTPAAPSTPAPRRLEPVPLVKQVYRNNCETAALEMILAAAGRSIGQVALQRELPRSGPLDPTLDAAGRIVVWGDPDRGFVGRAEGGGVAGGFGVYQGPIRRLAGRYGVTLRDLSRESPATLYRRLRGGRPVMAWIGLSEGPYRSWRSPAGKRISVNFGEHVVVLTRIRDGVLSVNDPLSGTRLAWTASEFERRWRLLGMRALGL